ncbi:MAG: ATP-binding cassette domain-containing protein [Lachnospiraceae bacterium]|nr:ATP-binding cassette domain-containing protein [Lachnospiraceae bacterium]
MDGIELKNIGKSYDGKVVFENVNLSFKSGTVTCFAGHNGCGKSTMLKVIAGLIPPTGGEVIRDKDLSLAYVPEKFSAVGMKALTYLKYMVKMDGIYDAAEGEQQIRLLAQDFFLTDMLEKPMRKLSKGTLQKIGVLQAFLRDPDVLLLDEPLSGQDTDSQQVFIRKVLEYKKAGRIIFLSAHEKELIKAVSDVVYTMEDGQVRSLHETLR